MALKDVLVQLKAYQAGQQGQQWVKCSERLPDVAAWWAVIHEGKPINMFDIQERAEESARKLGWGYTVQRFLPVSLESTPKPEGE